MVHKLLDSDDKQGEELNQDTRLYILPHYEQDPEDLVQFMMDSKDESIIFGLRLEDIEGEAKLQLTQDDKFTFSLVNHELDQGKLVGCVIAKSEYFGKFQGAIARVTTQGIAIYTKDLELKSLFTNTNITQILQIDGIYLYCLCDIST